MEIGDLTVGVQFTAQGFEAGVSAAQESLLSLSETVEKLDNVVNSASKNVGGSVSDHARAVESANAQSAASFAMIAAAAGAAFAKIVGAVSTGIQAFNQYKGAMIGLESVASYKNIGQSELTQGLDQIRDKFFDVTAASTSLKNLLSRGYTMEQAVQTITRLKDAAAFGRQASLGLAEAVVSATEGLKNENSMLVDNAGVTKNVAKMWEVWAKARGMKITDMTKEQKILAEYNGILEETAAQTGDLEKMSGGLQGAQADSATSVKLLAQSFGEAMAPTVGFINSLQSGIAGGLKSVVEASPEAAAGITGFVTAALGTVALTKAIQFMQHLAGAMKATAAASTILGVSMKAAFPWLAGIALLAGATTAIYTVIKRSQEAVANSDRKLETGVKESKDKAKAIQELGDRYEELRKKATKSLEDIREMSSIQGTLSNQYGVTAGAVEGLADSYYSLAEAAAAASKAQLENAKIQAEELYAKQRNKNKEVIGNVQNEWNWLKGSSSPKFLNNYSGWAVAIEETKKTALMALDTFEIDLRSKGRKLDDTLLFMGKNAIKAAVEGLDFKTLSPEELDKFLEESQRIIENFAQNESLSKSLETIDKVKEKLLGGEKLNSKEIEQFRSALSTIGTEYEGFYGKLEGLVGKEQADIIRTDMIASLKTNIGELFSFLNESGEQMSDGDFMKLLRGEISGAELEKSLGTYAQKAKEAIVVTEDLNNKTKLMNFDPMGASAEEANQFVADLNKELEGTTKTVNNLEKSSKMVASLKNFAKQFREGKISANEFRLAMKALGHEEIKTADQADALADTLGGALKEGIDNQLSSLEQYRDHLLQVQENARINGQIDVETAGAISRVNALIAVLRAAQFLMKLIGLGGSGEGKGGGGGGGKKDSEYAKAIKELEHDKKMDRVNTEQELSELYRIQNNFTKLTMEEERDLDERIHSARKKLHEEKLDMAYDEIEHLKTLGKINLEQEIEMLEKIKAAHMLSHDELIKLDEKLYSAKEALRKEKEEKVSGVGEGLIQALQKQYETMKDDEIKALEKSVEAYDDWADKRVKAIEKQIEALDRLSQQEDEEAKTAEELRKINKLKESYNFEQDAYNRANIAEQIRQAENTRAERLRKQEDKDKKEALRDEIKKINDEKAVKKDELDSQRKAIEEAYKGLTDKVSIEAEARRMIMEKSQQEILDLIGKYAPEYDALGRNLGQKWLDGFERAIGGVADYFDSFNKRLQALQETLAGQALGSVDKFWQGRSGTVDNSRVVHQTVNFNQPIESPGQVSKRLREVAEDVVYA